jgi:hypothetical protein
MVNEIAGAKDGEIEGSKKSETEPWTIPLGKHVTYNPSPFRDQADLTIKSVFIAFIIIIGVAVIVYAPGIEVLGILLIGSALFCYGSSIYEMRLLEKQTKHELR